MSWFHKFATIVFIFELPFAANIAMADAGMKSQPPRPISGFAETKTPKPENRGLHDNDTFIVDRITEGTAFIEGPDGIFPLPETILPFEVRHEGAAFCLVAAHEKKAGRIADAQQRIKRMLLISQNLNDPNHAAFAEQTR